MRVRELEARPLLKLTRGSQEIRQGGQIAALTTQLQRANKDTRGRRSNSAEATNPP